MNIIIIIENKIQGEYLNLIFDDPKYTVVTFYDGKEAFDFLIKEKLLDSVVIISYQLPNMDGIEIMRKTFEAGLEYAYVFLTADKTVERAVEAMKAGAMDFIPKSDKLKDEIIPLVEKTYRKQQKKLEQERLEKELAEKNLAIANSIQYAKRIQDALLPQDEFISHLFKECFVFFRPRDVVSGDFYWVSQKDKRYFIAAADCTGHGVPGAFMSTLGLIGLNQIVHYENSANNDITAGEILDRLRNFIIKSLRQTGKKGEAQDGMDIAFCIIDPTKREIQFAGANNPLYIIRDDKVEIVPADKMPIGVHKKANSNFKTNTFNYQPNDVFYIFSDGFSDQFGGEEGNKITTKRFRQILYDIHKYPMDIQKQILGDIFDSWKGTKYKQTDDVLVIGFKPIFGSDIPFVDEAQLSLKDKLILIVEDDNTSSYLLQNILSEFDAKFLTANNGKQAIEICKENLNIDLVLMDISMPIMDGNEAIQRIKALRPGLPIIVQSAFYNIEEKEKSFKMGCDEFIAKPINIKILTSLLKKYLIDGKHSYFSNIVWHSSYSLFNDELDQQHKELFNLTNELFSLLKQGKGPSILLKTTEKLIENTKIHFTYEENLMEQLNYPDLDNHRIEHMDLLNSATSYVNAIHKNKAHINLEVVSFFRDWLINHINKTDKKLANFIEKNQIKT